MFYIFAIYYTGLSEGGGIGFLSYLYASPWNDYQIRRFAFSLHFNVQVYVIFSKVIIKVFVSTENQRMLWISVHFVLPSDLILMHKKSFTRKTCTHHRCLVYKKSQISLT